MLERDHSVEAVQDNSAALAEPLATPANGSPAAGVQPPSPEAVAQALQVWSRARSQARQEVSVAKALVKWSRGKGKALAPSPERKAARAVHRDNLATAKRLEEQSRPAPLVPVLPPVSKLAGWLGFLHGRTAACVGLAAALMLLAWHEGSALLTRSKVSHYVGDPSSPTWQLLTSKEWFQRAQDRAEGGNFRLALGTVKYALATNPNDPALLNFQGNMLQSLFQFQDAHASYEHALRLDAANEAAHQNLVLCRRLSRYQTDPTAHPSTLYGLHRVMLNQKRINEAVAITSRFPKDLALRQSTWQAALEQTGLPGKIVMETDGTLSLDLSGIAQPDLSLIRDFPISRLNLADTGIEDVRALAGMPLRHLDLSYTLVYDLSPLKGIPLESLTLRGTGVVEISGLAGLPLRELDITNTRIKDLTPLAKAPLRSLQAMGTPVTNLTPLATLPLVFLDISGTQVENLQPLSSLGLHVLNLDGTIVSDLTALKGCPLQELYLASTKVHDLTPLRDMPVRIVSLTGCDANLDLGPLASCQELEHLRVPPRPQHMEALKELPHLRFTQS